MTNDLEKLIENLPFFLQQSLNQHPRRNQLIEIIVDLGRQPEVRFVTDCEFLSQKLVSWQDIDYIIKRVGQFSDENRAGINRTLNRISCIRNRQFLVNGLTCRVGRAVFGTISGIRDLLESRQSILVLGKPGVGKTTIIREMARILANEVKKRVIIIDTSNEIGGDSDIPHPGIGKARRMQVAKTELQHQIMIEAVENHMPQVIVIDEISTELEVLAARTIAEKGVQLVGTTHGNCIENLIKNPSLADLIGGIQYVTLSDEEARRRGTQKTILERKTYPTFERVIEINQPNHWIVYEDVKSCIDLLLRSNNWRMQRRYLFSVEKIKITSKERGNLPNSSHRMNQHSEDAVHLIPKNWCLVNREKNGNFLKLPSNNLIIYSYSVSNNLIQEILSRMGFKFFLTDDIRKATLIVGSKKNLTQNPTLLALARQRRIPIYTFRRVSFYEASRLIQFLWS